MNIRTGRKGWYKRTTAVDKTTSLAITVHDSDETLTSSSDLHSKIFAKSAKSIQTPSPNDAIDAMTLPFFMMGGHPLQTQALRGASSLSTRGAASSSSQAQVLALGDVGTARGPPAIPPQPVADVEMNDKDDEGSNSENDSSCQPTVNPFQLIHHALPTHSQHLASEKAKAKSASAKSAPASKAPAKSNAASRKRKTPEADDKENSQHVKILRLDGGRKSKDITPANATKTTETGLPSNTADEKISSEFNELYKHHMNNSLTVLGDADATVNEFLKSQQKELSTTYQQAQDKDQKSQATCRQRFDFGNRT